MVAFKYNFRKIKVGCLLPLVGICNPRPKLKWICNPRNAQILFWREYDGQKPKAQWLLVTNPTCSQSHE